MTTLTRERWDRVTAQAAEAVDETQHRHPEVGVAVLWREEAEAVAVQPAEWLDPGEVEQWCVDADGVPHPGPPPPPD